MKVLTINGSPHIKDGCVDRALQEFEKTIKECGIEVERINIGNKDIRGCISCNFCKTHNRCVFNDMVNEVAPKFEDADGIVVGTPVYYAGSNGQALAFLDRLFYSTSFSKQMKVGAAVISSRRAGSTSAFDEINKYFTIASMPKKASLSKKAEPTPTSSDKLICEVWGGREESLPAEEEDGADCHGHKSDSLADVERKSYSLHICPKWCIADE